MATGTIILRPSADISLGHSVYPADLSAGYLAINEEVSDDSATYIYSTHTDKTLPQSYSSIFSLSTSQQYKIKNITGCKMVIVDSYSSSLSSPYINVLLTIEETSFGEYSVIPGSLIGETQEITFSNEQDILEIINSYVSKNGVLPPIILNLSTSGTRSSSKNNGTLKVGQIYMELTGEFETGLNIYTKSNGTWKQATAVYQKQSGMWVEITEEEAKTILASNIIVKS